ncbi:ABC transporter substrate-binding protein [Kitasatospora sp. MAP5-34]|uniref:ABC transporter substrate-binding protein n=1 Tax=Kitasatospora sp. MAP5-34 TaxID=3035102 RepID=UPI002474B988|nr:ABC transporter substrate-binding protein [Kitasatospora sp. MAP5-34]MDH6577623.1 ABC-type branched-subunit amino acid transport system substrate-binding protein [Kitasatospora sp. MAP5-34]
MRSTGEREDQPQSSTARFQGSQRHRHRRTAGGLAAAALLPALLAASACAGPADAAAGDGDVTVMTWAPSGTGSADRPGMTRLADAIGRELDAKGGLSGHHVQVLTCNEHNTAEGASDCVRQAVAAHVIAVVGAYSQYADSFMPALEIADIPYIGGYGLSTPEFSSPLSYPVAGGTPALIAGSGLQLVAAGCRTVTLIRPNTQAGDTLAGYLSGALTPSGVELTDIKAPEKSNDYSAVAQQAIGSDQPGHCVSSALGAEPTSNLLDPYRRLQPKNTVFASVIGSVQQSVVDSTGGDSGPLGGAYATGWYPPEPSHVWDPLRATILGYGDGNVIDVSDPGVETTWVAYEVLRQAAGRIAPGTPLTARSLRAVLDRGDPIDTSGATPPLSWTMTNMLASADSPRLVNTSVTFQQVRGGRLVEQQSTFVDVRWVLAGGKPPA